jgi:cell division protein FtsN
MWLLTGVLIGLGLAWYLFAKGYIPQPRAEEDPTAQTLTPGNTGGSEEVAPRGKDSERPKYDFFTVLPEMEVVVPEQQLERELSAPPAATESAAASPAGDGPGYLLQVGSFRASADAEQMKARLALLGFVARVQTVTVNDSTWHRVRVGPVSSARQADDMRNRLADNGIDSLVLRAGSE